MHTKVSFHLFVPNLFQTLKYCFTDLSLNLEAYHLSKLLQKYEKQDNNYFGLENAYFNLLSPSLKELPSAHYRYQTHNNDIKENLICADPVYLQVGMNDVTLKNRVVDLTDAEALELIALFNDHFKEDGIEFIFGSNQSWYIASDKDEEIHSYNLESLLMKNVVDKQLQSNQRNWQGIQNEIQMLLHDADINRHREMAGLEIVNSLWLWGAGKPIKSKKIINAVYYSKDSKKQNVYEYLAKATDCDLKLLPTHLKAILEKKTHNHQSNIIFLDPLIAPISSEEIANFQDQLKIIDEQIFGPLFSAWKTNKIDIELHNCDGSVVKPIRRTFFKSFLKSKSLRELVNDTCS